MSNDFSTYNYHGKTIRVMRDQTDNKNWFVVVDVLSLLINNAEVFGKKSKIKH